MELVCFHLRHAVVRGDVTHHRFRHVMRQGHLHALALVQPFIVARHQRHDRHAVLTNIQPACSLGISPSPASVRDGVQRAETQGVKQVGNLWRYEYAETTAGGNTKPPTYGGGQSGSTRSAGGASVLARRGRRMMCVLHHHTQAGPRRQHAPCGPQYSPGHPRPCGSSRCAWWPASLRAEPQSNHAARPRPLVWLLRPKGEGHAQCGTRGVYDAVSRVISHGGVSCNGVRTLRLCSSANRSMAAFGEVGPLSCMLSPLPAAWPDMERASTALRATPSPKPWCWASAYVSNGRKRCTRCRRRPR